MQLLEVLRGAPCGRCSSCRCRRGRCKRRTRRCGASRRPSKGLYSSGSFSCSWGCSCGQLTGGLLTAPDLHPLSHLERSVGLCRSRSSGRMGYGVLACQRTHAQGGKCLQHPPLGRRRGGPRLRRAPETWQEEGRCPGAEGEGGALGGCPPTCVAWPVTRHTLTQPQGPIPKQ